MLLVSIYAGCAGFTVIVAVEEVEGGMGRICKWQIVDASAKSLIPFGENSLMAGSTIQTDGWLGYLPLKNNG